MKQIATHHAPHYVVRPPRPLSRRRRASCPSDEVLGGLFSDFESLEDVGAVAARQRERGRVDGVPRHREAVVMIIRASTHRAGLAASGKNICYLRGRLPSVYITLLARSRPAIISSRKRRGRAREARDRARLEVWEWILLCGLRGRRGGVGRCACFRGCCR